MDAYAVIETGGKQYRVSAGDRVQIEKMDVEAGQAVEMADVLMVSDGENVQIGRPVVEGAKVTGTVLDQTRGDKVVSFKKKRRKGYTRKVGHRQDLTVVRIDAVQ